MVYVLDSDNQLLLLLSSFLLFYCRIPNVKKLYIDNTQVKINKIFESKIVNIFLPISFSICFGCSKEPSQLSQVIRTVSLR